MKREKECDQGEGAEDNGNSWKKISRTSRSQKREGQMSQDEVKKCRFKKKISWQRLLEGEKLQKRRGKVEKLREKREGGQISVKKTT